MHLGAIKNVGFEAIITSSLRKEKKMENLNLLVILLIELTLKI